MVSILDCYNDLDAIVFIFNSLVDNNLINKVFLGNEGKIIEQINKIFWK